MLVSPPTSNVEVPLGPEPTWFWVLWEAIFYPSHSTFVVLLLVQKYWVGRYKNYSNNTTTEVSVSFFTEYFADASAVEAEVKSALSVGDMGDIILTLEEVAEMLPFSREESMNLVINETVPETYRLVLFNMMKV